MKTRVLFLAATAATILAAACTGGKKSTAHNPLPVYDDVYVTGQFNNRILVDGDIAWIVNSGDDTVDGVDLTTCTTQLHSCQRVRQVVFPVGANPFDMVIDGGKLWVTGLFSNAIYRVDPATGTIEATVTTGAGFAFANPQSIAPAGGGKLLVSNAHYGQNFDFLNGFVSIVMGTSIVGQVATSEKVPVGFTPWVDGNVAVVNNGVADFTTGVGVAVTAGSIDVIDDTAAGSVARTIDLGLTLPGPSVAVSTDGQYAFTGSGNAGATLLRVDISTGAVTPTNFSTASTFVSDVVIDQGVVYVLSFLEDRVYAVDEQTLQPVFLSTNGTPTSFVTVGPGGAAPKGPVFATVWHHNGEKHLLVLLTLSNSVTDVLLP